MRRSSGNKRPTPRPITMRPSTSSGYRVKGPVRGQTRPSIYSDLARPRRRSPLGAVVAAVAVIVVLIIVFGPLIGAEPAPEPSSDAVTDEVPSSEVSFDDDSAEDGSDALIVGDGVMTESGPGRVSLCAVGDNVVNEELIVSADRAAGEIGDGAYDFTPLLAAVAPTIENEYDIAFINQETVLGGDERFPFAGYPSFNSPDEVAQALVEGGFDVINCNSNHSFDIGAPAIRHEIELWSSYPDVLTIGMFNTTEEAQRVRMIERNGVRIAFLSYNYGLNGYEAAEEGTFVDLETHDRFDYDGSIVNLITETKLARDIPRAKAVADAVIVSMHFGEEYRHAPDEYQRQWAQRCADLGADVVIGTHPHFVQPVEWITGAEGAQTLVAWSLGDFISGYGRMDASLGGMLAFDLLKGDDGGIAIENLTWTPTIEHLQNGAYSVHFLKDYTPEQAAANELYTVYSSAYNTQEMVADIRTYAQTLAETVMGDQIAIDGIAAERDPADAQGATADQG